MCGFYLNELLLRLLPRDDPHEALFDAYGEALAASRRRRRSVVLRGFEKRLLAELGYAPLLDRDAASRPIDPDALRLRARARPGGERHARGSCV
jgi:DNA repair protein RecO (recombination protein O)